MGMSQGEAVYQAVVAVMESIDGAVQPSKQQLAAIEDRVFQFFKSGECTHSKQPSDAQLKKYIPGLVNNWLRKDKRLNGGNKYVAKNPGSRTGSGDEILKNLRLLLSVTTDPEAKDKVSAAITERLNQLKPQATIDVSMLPENLRHLVNN